MIPGGAEEHLAGLAPKAIRPLARIATSALGSGTVNAAQGGSFGTGAALGAGWRSHRAGIEERRLPPWLRKRSGFAASLIAPSIRLPARLH